MYHRKNAIKHRARARSSSHEQVQLIIPPVILPAIISVKEARKLLGTNGTDIPDDQVEVLIAVLTDMAEEFLRNAGSKVK